LRKEHENILVERLELSGVSAGKLKVPICFSLFYKFRTFSIQSTASPAEVGPQPSDQSGENRFFTLTNGLVSLHVSELLLAGQRFKTF
jgi:hypothetical protein